MLTSSVTRLDSQTVVASCALDVPVSECRLLIEAALVHALKLTTVSVDDDQAFLVFKSQWLQPNGGLHFTFSVSGTRAKSTHVATPLTKVLPRPDSLESGSSPRFSTRSNWLCLRCTRRIWRNRAYSHSGPGRIKATVIKYFVIGHPNNSLGCSSTVRVSWSSTASDRITTLTAGLSTGRLRP